MKFPPCRQDAITAHHRCAWSEMTVTRKRGGGFSLFLSDAQRGQFVNYRYRLCSLCDAKTLAWTNRETGCPANVGRALTRALGPLIPARTSAHTTTRGTRAKHMGSPKPSQTQPPGIQTNRQHTASNHASQRCFVLSTLLTLPLPCRSPASCSSTKASGDQHSFPRARDLRGNTSLELACPRRTTAEELPGRRPTSNNLSPLRP